MKFNPVNADLYIPNEKISLDVINYHYRGACFKVACGDYRILHKEAYFRFKIGNKEIAEKILFRITWETIEKNGLFGVEFRAESTYVLSRAERFMSHSVNAPIISSQDPLDPNRILYFKAINVSTTGMLLSTSLTNKHLFPGMELRTAVLEIPGMGKADVELFIENSRPVDEEKTVLYGVSVKGASHNYISLISKYLSNLGATENADERLDKLSEANLIQKNLSKHLTIREIKIKSEYDEVLKLRYIGYKGAGKVKEEYTWQDMGEGLEKEGVLIGAYLGAQLVASAEFRFHRTHGLTLSKRVDITSLQCIRSDNLSEINKLVVHPKAQNTDIVLGIFQKIHALAMLNGRPDGIIAAEDSLVSLYERLGFKKMSYSYPHPSKANINLNLMIIYSEAYATSAGMNPYAWSLAFEETRRFFFEIGIQRENNLNFQQKVTKAATKVFLKLKGKKKASAKKHVSDKTKDKFTRSIVDPKWTRQHLNATIILPYILEAQDMVGKAWVAKALLEFGFEVQYFRSVSNWVSIEFFDEFLSKFSEAGDANLLNKKAGYRSTSKEILGANYFVIKHFISPGLMFKSLEKYMPKFNKTRIYKVIQSDARSCRIRITTPDIALLPKSKSAKENWTALIDSYVLTATGKSANIEIVKSSFDGDLYCEYNVSWSNPFFKTKNIATYATMVTLFGYSALLISRLFTALQFIALIGSLSLILCFGFMLWKIFFLRGRYQEIIESFSSFEKEAEERYRELQSSKSILESSYQEGKLLENINREIQKSDNIRNILQTASISICEKFGFSRSFIMIADDSQKIMRTSEVYGNPEDTQDIWQFKIDISKQRENPFVLSSVFHTGQSILITDIEEHKYHLNETSRRLIDRLGTKGFVAVPIPSDQKNWGVLVADKGVNDGIISRRDLVALQRVAQSMGLALDKKAKIDSETNIRKIFQKFVPSAIVENTLGQKDVHLGGETKEAICLFMDIRNFTKLSTEIPPQILIEILNNIFQILHKSVSPSGGVIDKFLGDGALVTWGAIPGSTLNADAAISAAITFCKNISEFCESLKSKGLNSIEVGIGIHKGPVIAGNIGANERMEFTVIGSTVNLASRLEQLTKVLNAHIVVSENVKPFETLSEKWVVHNKIRVRGLDVPVNVAALNLNSSETQQAESA
ncbi:MAG: adenylate/guanylate cyclase domain-containing protein [Bdellovibrionota bacterium]